VTGLYSIPAEWGALLQKLEEGGGEFTSEIETEMAALISASKERVEAAALAKRNIELRAESAMAQAKVFQEEAEACKAVAASLQARADRIGAAMADALELTGKVQTPAGTVYLRKGAHWAFELAQGVEHYMLPAGLWRQREPELNRTALKELAEKDELPEGILSMRQETRAVCLKRPAPTERKEQK